MYARNIVKKFGIDSKKHASTPMSSSTKLNADSFKVEVSPTLYRSIIGSLLYLTTSRPDIAFSGSNACLAGYSDADWAGSVDDRKSTSGGCFYLGNNLVSWMSKKQNFVSLSTAEAEYIVAVSCCTQLLWMKKLLHDYRILQDTMCLL
nr:uncharacterized protein LOC112030148 [Quercus suber]